MATVERRSGVRVVTPDTIDVPTAPAGRRGITLPTGPVPIDTGDEQLAEAALAEADFEIVDEIDLVPNLEATGPSGVRRRGAPPLPESQDVRLDVAVPPGQDALVLLEQDGVYTWVLPSETATAVTRAAGATRTFELTIHAESDVTRAQRGFIDDVVFAKAKAFVLRYVAAPAGRAAVGFFERVDEGVVAMPADSLENWRQVDPADLTVPAGGRVLLWVHGTFSSTVGSFGALAVTGPGRALLAEAHRAYDLVIGVDHKTLSVDPLVNARDIVEWLSGIDGIQGARIDAVGYSRGGLVLRSIIERVLPESGLGAVVERAAFVGVTHRGTNLASVDNWRRLVDLYTNLAMSASQGLALIAPGTAGAAAVAAASVKVIGAVVKTLAEGLLEAGGIPGLAAMEPSGPFVADINTVQAGQPGPDEITYFAITSDFEPDDQSPLPRKLVKLLKDGFMDQLMAEPNDLVVHTASMTAVEDPAYLGDVREFGTNGTVHHTNYFHQPEVAGWLARWLDLEPRQAAVEPTTGPGPRRRSATRGAGPSDEGVPMGVGTEGGVVQLDAAAGIDDPVQLGTEATVEVRIGTTEVAGPMAATGSGEFADDRPIIVQLVCRRGFAPVGPTRASVDPPFDLPIDRYFDVRATDLGQGQIDVVLRQGQVPVITLELKPTVIAEAPTSVARAAGSGQAAPAPTLARPLHQLRINERFSDGKVVYDFDFESEELGLLLRESSNPLEVDREAYVARLFSEIEQRWLGSAGDVENFRQDLRAYGAALFRELVPASIQAALWEHRDRITAVQVISTEPFIPWEVVHLTEPGGPLGGEEYFLGEMGLVRWLHGSWPPAQIRVRPGRVRAVIPKYPQQTQYHLPHAEAELGYLVDAFGASEVPPAKGDVRTLIAEPGAFDLLHFAGHGLAEAADIGNAKLMMEGRIDGSSYVPEYLDATTVAGFAALEGADGNRPIVVLNACQVGRAGYQLTSIGGFAAAFIGAGAGAFVSSLWSVGDAPARTFTEAWYAELLDGATITEATIRARRKAAEDGDATWLAYTVYAHPHATITPA